MKKVILIVSALIIVWIGIRTEIDVGRCYDCYGNGKLYNGEPYFNYIRYDENEVGENDIVVSFFLYNPLNNECDDIVYRKDFIILEDQK